MLLLVSGENGENYINGRRNRVFMTSRIRVKGISTVDYTNLEEQLASYEQAQKGKCYLLRLVGKDTFARAGILKFFEEEVVAYERFPVHGVSGFGRGCNDSYDGLRKILQEGFTSLVMGDLNASISVEDPAYLFSDLVFGKRKSIWGHGSKRKETEGDRYFLEFSRFNAHNWEIRGPWDIIRDMHTNVDEVQPADIRVNVILGTRDPAQQEQRKEMYQQLFETARAQSRYF